MWTDVLARAFECEKAIHDMRPVMYVTNILVYAKYAVCLDIEYIWNFAMCRFNLPTHLCFQREEN